MGHRHEPRRRFPELHYMRGPGPKWRERHVAKDVEERANHPSSAWVMLAPFAVRDSVRLIAFIVLCGIARTSIPASCKYGGNVN